MILKGLGVVVLVNIVFLGLVVMRYLRSRPQSNESILKKINDDLEKRYRNEESFYFY